MSDELPKGWASTPFMDVFDIQGGTQPPKSTFKYEPTKGYVRLLQIRDFGEKPLPTFIPSKHTLKTCQQDDILIGRYGASIGRICTGMEGAYNVALAKVIIPEQIDRRFVFHVLRSPFFQRPILDIERSAQDGFNKEDLAEIILPLAPLAEQRRIVAKLEKLLGQVDACQQRLEKMPTLLKRFRQSILAAACSGRLTADWRGFKFEGQIVPPVNIGMPEEIDCVKGWSWKKLSELARLESGHTPRKTISEYWEGGDVPWICLQDIRAANGKVISETVLKPTMHGIDNSSARMLPKGTVVFSRDISVGYVAIMGREMATSQHFADWICGPELNNQFLMYALMASRQHLISSQQGSTVGTIYMPALKEFHLLTPPLAEQQEIVRRVVGLLALADQLEQRLAQARRQVDKLTPSLLARAFAGRLVPQDPNDEPAEKLLDRILCK